MNCLYWNGTNLGSKYQSGPSNLAIKSPAEKMGWNGNRQIWKKIDIRNVFWKKRKVGVFDLGGLVKVW